MAGGIILDGKGDKEYPGKLTGTVFLACLFAATGGLIFGYDLGISGGVTSMPTFLKEFFPEVYRRQSRAHDVNQYCKFNSVVLTLFTSSLYLAALLSSMVASYFTRKMGRRLSMGIGGLLFLIGSIINGAAQNVYMLIGGRIFLGFGIGFANQSVPLFLAEMAPYKHRGSLNMMFQLSITIGIFVANLINYGTAQIKGGWGWRVSLAGAAVPAIIIIIGAIRLPETPNSLVERGRVEEARSKLIKVRGVSEIDDELNDIINASEKSKQVKHPFRTLFSRPYRPHLVFSICIPMFQQLTGNNMITFYAPVLFKTMGFGDMASLSSALITGSVNALATLVSIFTVDRVGRRFLFLQGGSQMLLMQLSIAGLIGWKFGTDGNPGALPVWYADLLVVLICVYVSGFAWSWGPLGWLVPSEIFPLEVRSAAQSMNVAVNMFFTFGIAQVFLPLLCWMKYGLFIFFAFWLIVMSVFIALYLPETKNVPIEDMIVVWKNHPRWSKYIPDQAIPPELRFATTGRHETDKDDASA